MGKMSFEPRYIDSEPGLLITHAIPAHRRDSVSILRERYKKLGNPQCQKDSKELLYIYLFSM